LSRPNRKACPKPAQRDGYRDDDRGPWPIDEDGGDHERQRRVALYDTGAGAIGEADRAL